MILQALKIESNLVSVQNPADTHINACAVLSQLGRHEAAYQHAQTSLIHLQKELLSPLEESDKAPPQADRIAVLAIAYHNLGVEQEFLKEYDASVISYQKGVEVAERYLGATHPITATLTSSLIAAKKSAAKMKSKTKLSKTSSTMRKTAVLD
jgi:tetratricopeptide (TPR) repeat protein